MADALFHFARRLIGKGYGENLTGPCDLCRDFISNTGGQGARLAGSGAGQQQKRAVICRHCGALFIIQTVKQRFNAAHGAGLRCALRNRQTVVRHTRIGCRLCGRVGA